MSSRALEPLPAAEWDQDAAAHLLRRAGFGGAPAEVERVLRLGPDAAVDELVDAPVRDPELDAAIADAGGMLTDPEIEGYRALASLRARWLFRMLYGSAPLRERMALFWHDHFATQERGGALPPYMMGRQNELFRHAGLGSFPELVLGVARDPAMLVFLDNRISRAGSPNENWARELMELFTLGLDEYSQADVLEVARVFTGWTTPHSRSAQFSFESGWHDDADKVVLGRRVRGRFGDRGQEEGREVVEILCAEPACRRFLARKLLAWFVTAEPAAEHVDAFADELERAELAIGEALRTLLRSRLFFAPEHRFTRYASPVDLVVGALHALDVQNAHHLSLDTWLRRMGMSLFHPPSVAGWEQGPAWITSGTLLERLNFAALLSDLPHTARPVVGSAAVDLDRLTRPGATPAEAVAALSDRLLGRRLDPERAELLSGHLANRDTSTTAQRNRARTLIYLLLGSPEAQLI